jgi:arginine/lysine/ornithine decarboxylase
MSVDEVRERNQEKGEAEAAGERAFWADVGMNNGVDNRHQSWQVEPAAMERSPRPWAPIRRCSRPTAARSVAMMAAVKPGETLVMARNGHKSAHPEAQAVMPFTPTYYGVSADVESLPEVCHARGLPLLTADDAWGLDHSLCSRLAQSTSASSLLGAALDRAQRLRAAAAGVMVEGAADETLEQFRVVA